MNRRSARIDILIQARMWSRRLPGKVLRPLAGRPVPDYVTDRCRRAEGAAMAAVTTATERGNGAVAALGEKAGLAVFRWRLNDGAGWFVQSAYASDLDIVVRRSADSRLIDPCPINHAIARCRAGALAGSHRAAHPQ